MSAGAFEAHLAQWRAREPEMEVAEAFCTPAEAGRYRVWGTLLNELHESLHGPAEPAVAQARLGWWMQELGAAAARHPVSAAAAQLGIEPGSLAAVAVEAARLAQQERAPRGLEEALQLLQPLAAAIAEAEHSLFAPQAVPQHGAVAAGLLCRIASDATSGRALARERLPLDLLARFPEGGDADSGALRQALAAALLPQAEPAARGAALFRRARSGYDRWLLACWERDGRARRIPPWRALWIAHRAARGAARP